MYIDKIKRKGKTKYLFFSDGRYLFYLTAPELREYGIYDAVIDLVEEEQFTPCNQKPDTSVDTASQYKICKSERKNASGIQKRVEIHTENGIELSAAVYDILLQEVILPRGKRYALGLLADRDYTVSGMQDKISGAGYSEADAKTILDYIIKYNYLNDVRYATSYIRFREKNKSRRYIEGQLLLKGVSKEDIQKAYENIEEEHSLMGIDEQVLTDEAIKKLLSRKLKGEDPAGPNQELVTKALQSLVRSGYKYSDVKRCINEYFED